MLHVANPTATNICFVPWSPKRSATMLDLNNIAADRCHKGPLGKQFPWWYNSFTMVVQIFLLSESTLWRPVEHGRNVAISIYMTAVRQTINETFIHIIHDEKFLSWLYLYRIICKGYISHHGRWRWCWICLHSSFNIVGDTHAYYTWSPKSCGRILHMMHCRS